MAKNLSQSELIDLLTRSVREGLVRELSPAISRLVEAANQLQGALGAEAPKRRGRKPGSGKASVAPVAPAATPAAGRKGRRKMGNAPRGALKKNVMEILRKSSKPMTLSAIVDLVMKTPDFVGRNQKSIYNKVNADLSKAPEVTRISKGVYSLKKK